MSFPEPPTREDWFAAMEDCCAVCGYRLGLQQHHAVYLQHVRREGGNWWDPRNGITLCPIHHADHHGRRDVLALTVLPDSAFEFAAELFGSLKAYEFLRRRYRGDDPRLDALLDGEPEDMREYLARVYA